ncbi:CatA-like O-acetyltransferase [Adhaeribacter pallidiroseus]|uniref:Chloramphenicol O-acetyltransferase n=1 Tax=Adhaeribacter pallidiroseus TaxID=2072847 RepID=A0A369QWA3_9BACT|nr:CatA-like O-acetyltransferase [Adhaeribacter pallidiroseus]RDC66438.1 Chloramphenicol O-acetyltransferase [Adhaeribacter pallidiroseus]
MKKELSINTWNRQEHFQFFSRFEEPFFSLVANLDGTVAYQKAKTADSSFYLYYLYLSLAAANTIENFRYRIEAEKIFCYDSIHASPTVLRDDKTFGFSFLEYQPDFSEFAHMANAAIQEVKASSGLNLNQNTGRPDVIHYSAIPWITFTGLSHARSFSFKDSVPKITFGKYFWDQNKLLLPVSISVHHGLMDGYHVSEFLKKYQELLNA